MIISMTDTDKSLGVIIRINQRKSFLITMIWVSLLNFIQVNLMEMKKHLHFQLSATLTDSGIYTLIEGREMDLPKQLVSKSNENTTINEYLNT
jgi:hypothetical protein